MKGILPYNNAKSWSFDPLSLKYPNHKETVLKHMEEYWNLNLNTINNPIQVWAAHKSVIRGVLIQIKSHAKRKAKALVDSLQHDIANLEKRHKLSGSPSLYKSLLDKRQALDKMLSDRSSRAGLRLQSKYFLYANKPDKFMAYKIRNRTRDMSIPALYNSQGVLTSNPKDIVASFATYYGSLYDGQKVSRTKTIRNSLDTFLEEAALPKISKQELDSLNADITDREVLGVLKDLKPGKAAGPDGFPGDYYKQFKPTLTKHIVQFCNSILKGHKIPSELLNAKIIVLPKPASYSSGSSCSLDGSDMIGIIQDGDILVGAVLPLHMDRIYPKMSYKEKPGNVICKMFPVENYLQLHAMRFAIEEINNNPELLPNTTLGFKIYDSCALLQRELEGTLWMVTGQNKAIANFQCQEKEQMAAIIGHSISTYSILMAHILGLARYPHVREIKLEIISHFSTSSLLSDRTQFKSFFRTVPSDTFQSQGLAKLVLHFGWTWVGLVAVDNDYGQQGIQVIRREIQKAGACVAFTEYIQISRPDYNTPYIVHVIKESTAKAVVVFSTDLSLIPLFDEILKQNVTGRIWIASEAWASFAYLFTEKYSRILVGTIGFAFHTEEMPGFYDFIGQIQPYDSPGETWTKMFLEETVGCTLFEFQNYPLHWDRPKINCTDVAVNFQSILRNSPNIRISYNLYSAVYVIAKALHDLSLCKIGKGPFSNNSCSSLWDFTPWQNNVFTFDGQIYKQIRGTAMGAVCAPTYACLHLGAWESDIFERHSDTFNNKVLMWVRYVDDVLVLWDGSVEEFHDFVHELNHNDRNIILTSETNKTELNFLDITIKKEGLKIVTENFRKKNATNSILHADSGHPVHLIKGIPYGQFLRLRRNCSSLTKFDTHAALMKERFLKRGYSNKCLKKALWKARKTPRDHLLYNNKSKPKETQIRFITKFNNQWSNIRSALANNWHILTLDDKLLYYMQKVRVRLSSGRQIYFDENGDPPAVYDIVHWKLDPEGKLKLINVGSYDTSATDGKTLNINISAMLWNTGDQKVPRSVCSEKCLMGFRKAVIKGVPACCFNCVPCAQGEIANQADSGECYKCPWNSWPNYQKDKCLPKSIEFLSYEETLGITLAGISVTSSIIPVAVLALLIYYKTTPIVRANNYILSCLLLVSLTLCFLCSLFFIGYPNPEKCLLRQTAFGVAFAFCVSCILAKTIMVVIAFKATKPHSVLKRWTSPRFSYSIIGLSTLLQFVMCIIWLALYTPFPFYNSKTESSVIILECSEGSSMAFWCILGYLSFLATISFLVAFLSRKLPGSFNEAKFITFSMLAFLTVWGSFIPAYLSTTGKYMVAMEVFAILSSSWAMLSCMFASKCYIILFQPKMNSRQHLMGRTKAQTIQK
ncbi:uncharacterized protein LOC128664684 [Bombina bombina]|uniref:uncharacterized protein LOC128664684 n=1 Tax=Bombina bombina TaxID=8345 RepID=UPI00235AC8CF|nr:uncharacterized protein LOC128664684 [Bombina bombina]